jgi:molybdate transport system regulatory protein
MNSRREKNPILSGQQSPLPKSMNQGRIVSMPDEVQCLDTVQLNRLQQCFRDWADCSPRADVRLFRRRILVIFLLIRCTGAKLNEAPALNPFKDIDPERQSVLFRRIFCLPWAVVL